MVTTANEANYENAVTVRAAPERVFVALTMEMHRWWTTHTDGSLERVGDTIRVDFPPNNGHWTFEATALSPREIVELTCIDALHVVAGQSAEIERDWLGTTLCWRICATGTGSRVHFEHRGLTPKLQCFDICHAGWNFFFARSLAAFLNEGTGMPHQAA